MKTYHMAAKCTEMGAVSPLCAKRPRKIDLSKECWTIRPKAVTCKKCIALLPAEPEPVKITHRMTSCSFCTGDVRVDKVKKCAECERDGLCEKCEWEHGCEGI